MEEKRIYKWDNLKAILIALVILGHGISEVTDDSVTMEILYFYIYIFHMPLFMYVSGMFAGNTVRDPERCKTRILQYIFLALLLRFLILGIKVIFGRWDPGDFQLLKDNGLTWYLTVLAMYLGVTRLLRNVSYPFLLGFAFLASLMIGYDTSVGSTFALSRFFVFYPFFLLGYKTDPKRSWKQTENTRCRLIAASFLLIVFVIVWKGIPVLREYKDLIMGWCSYRKIPHMELGFFFRAFYYLVASLMGAAVITLVPRRRTAYSFLGPRTLQLYIWHRPIIYLMVYGGIKKLCRLIWPAHFSILFLALQILFTVVLIHPVFGQILDGLFRQIRSGDRQETSVRRRQSEAPEVKKHRR